MERLIFIHVVYGIVPSNCCHDWAGFEHKTAVERSKFSATATRLRLFAYFLQMSLWKLRKLFTSCEPLWSSISFSFFFTVCSLPALWPSYSCFHYLTFLTNFPIVYLMSQLCSICDLSICYPSLSSVIHPIFSMFSDYSIICLVSQEIFILLMCLKNFRFHFFMSWNMFDIHSVSSLLPLPYSIAISNISSLSPLHFLHSSFRVHYQQFRRI